MKSENGGQSETLEVIWDPGTILHLNMPYDRWPSERDSLSTPDLKQLIQPISVSNRTN